MDSFTEIWEAVCVECKKEVTDVGFNVWIKDLIPLEIGAGEVVLGIYSIYKKNIIELNYSDVLERSFEAVLGFPVTIKIVHKDPNQKVTVRLVPSEGSSPAIYSFDNFIVGSTNRFAHAAAFAVSEKPSDIYNPLFIYGNSGVGKTHLLYAIKNHITHKFPQKKLVYIRGEDFTNALIEAIQNGSINLFHARFRSADVLLVDDIQFIAGKESTQEEFFNTFNALYQENKQIVLTSDRPPKDIKTLDERIRSRFESGLLADIAPPDFETRVGIIHRKSDLMGISLDDNVTYYIAEQVKMNTRQLEGVVKKLQAYIELQQKEPSITVVHGYIRDIVNDSTPEPLTQKKVISEVAKTYNLTEEEICSRRKTGNIVRARQISMYIIRQMTQLSYKAIGEQFGKDHTTVLYTVQKIENELKENPSEKLLIEDIISNLKS